MAFKQVKVVKQGEIVGKAYSSTLYVGVLYQGTTEMADPSTYLVDGSKTNNDGVALGDDQWAFAFSKTGIYRYYTGATKATATPTDQLEYIVTDDIDFPLQSNILHYIPESLHTAILNYTSTDDVSSYIQTAITESITNGTVLEFPRGKYYVASTIQVNTRGAVLVGAFGERTAQYGVVISYVGTGPCIQIGTDDGKAWDRAGYDGYQSFAVSNIEFAYGGTLDGANLSTLTTSYKTGTYGIRDWRGGDVRLSDVIFESFEYGFWGIQSDFNVFKVFQSRYCRYGIYAGPRSDQFTIEEAVFGYNETGLVVDGSSGIWPSNLTFVNCVSPTTPSIDIRCGSGLVSIRNLWLENYGGPDVTNNDAYVYIGVNNGWTGTTSGGSASVATKPKGVYLNEVLLLNTGVGANKNVQYFANVKTVEECKINNINVSSGLSDTNFVACFKFSGDYTGSDSIELQTTLQGFTNNAYAITGSGTPNPEITLLTPGGSAMYNSTGRWSIGVIGDTTNSKKFTWTNNGSTTSMQAWIGNVLNNTTQRLFLPNRIIYNGSVPYNRAWDRGDQIVKSDVSTTNNISRWVCVTSSAEGTGVSITGRSGDKLLSASHGLSDGDIVKMEIGGTIPPLSNGIYYYVVNKTTDDFEVADSEGGATKILTGFTGTNNFKKVTKAVFRAVGVGQGGGSVGFTPKEEDTNYLHYDSVNHRFEIVTGANSTTRFSGMKDNGTLMDADYTWSNVVGANYGIVCLAIKNPTGSSVTINVGTTAGGTDVVNAFVLASGVTKVFFGGDSLLLNNYFSASTTQTLYFSSGSWPGGNLVVSLKQTYIGV